MAYNIVVAFVNECNETWVAFDETPCFSTFFSIIFTFSSFSFSSISLPSAVYYLFHHLFLYCLFFFFNFPSFCSLYFFFFYFLLQPMLVITSLSWCRKFQLHFMSLMPQIKVTFIKLECLKSKPCPSEKKMTRVRVSNIT